MRPEGLVLDTPAIDHKKLLHKLDNYGIRGVARDLIKSYLRNRLQYTETLGEKSESLNVTYIVRRTTGLDFRPFAIPTLYK